MTPGECDLRQLVPRNHHCLSQSFLLPKAIFCGNWRIISVRSLASVDGDHRAYGQTGFGCVSARACRAYAKLVVVRRARDVSDAKK
jgi:hypothetical protein